MRHAPIMSFSVSFIFLLACPDKAAAANSRFTFCSCSTYRHQPVDKTPISLDEPSIFDPQQTHGWST